MRDVTPEIAPVAISLTSINPLNHKFCWLEFSKVRKFKSTYQTPSFCTRTHIKQHLQGTWTRKHRCTSVPFQPYFRNTEQTDRTKQTSTSFASTHVHKYVAFCLKTTKPLLSPNPSPSGCRPRLDWVIPFCSSRSPTVRDYGRWTTSDVGRLHFCMPSRHTRASNAARSLFQLARHYLRVLEFVEPPRTNRPTDRPTASNVKVRSRWLLSFCYSNGPGSHTCTTDYTTLARYVRTHTRFVYWMGLPTREHPPGKVVSRSAARPVSTHQLFQAKAKHCVLRY